MPDDRMQGTSADCVVGIDAGGTGVRVLVCRADSTRVWEGEAHADPDGGPAPAVALLRERKVVARSIAAGIAKISRPGVESAWREALAEFALPARTTVVPDYEIGFWSAVPDGVGVAVLAGTGSVAFGRAANGDSVRVGGRGWEYGDEGSGTFLTEALLRRTVRALDGLSPISPLQAAAAVFLGASDAGTLVTQARLRAASEGRGFLVPLLLDRATRENDLEARNLFVGAAGWLATLAGTALHRLGVCESDSPLVSGVGGLWRAEALLSAPFEEVLRRKYPGAVFHISRRAPIEGAVRLALHGNVAENDLV